PVAPALAARREGRTVPNVDAILAAKPQPSHAERRLLIETFGGPFSPLTDDVLQLDLIRRLALPCVLLVSSTVGAVGRTLLTLRALAAESVRPVALILVGPPDEFAVEQIALHAADLAVFSLQAPDEWSVQGVEDAARRQLGTLMRLWGQLSS